MRSRRAGKDLPAGAVRQDRLLLRRRLLRSRARIARAVLHAGDARGVGIRVTAVRRHAYRPRIGREQGELRPDPGAGQQGQAVDTDLHARRAARPQEVVQDGGAVCQRGGLHLLEGEVTRNIDTETTANELIAEMNDMWEEWFGEDERESALYRELLYDQRRLANEITLFKAQTYFTSFAHFAN